MNEKRDRAVYRTDPLRISRSRFLFRLVLCIGPLAFAAVALAGSHSIALALLLATGAFGVMLLNGSRTVIGVVVSPDQLVIVTPFAEAPLPWHMVAIKQYPAPFSRTDFDVSGRLWPYMWGHGVRPCEEDREALQMIEHYSR